MVAVELLRSGWDIYWKQSAALVDALEVRSEGTKAMQMPPGLLAGTGT